MSAPLTGQARSAKVTSPDLISLLAHTQRLMSRRLTAILDDEGCPPDAWRVLTLLADGDGHPMTEIADFAFLPPATLTKLVDHLVEHNLVYRRVDPVDRRRIRAYLTTRGHAVHQRVSERLHASMRELPMPAGDQEALSGLLTVLVESLRS
jgi:DNA-binding MarR family transcriptional regulator